MGTNVEKLRIAKLVWMLYFNKTLLDRGVISEAEFNKMKLKIQERYPLQQK